MFFFRIITLLCFSSVLLAQGSAEAFKTADDPAEWVIENFYAIRAANTDSALHYVNLALPIAEASGNVAQQARLYQQKGVTYYFLGDFEKELDYFQKGLRLAESIGDEALQGDILKELGLTYNRQKDYETAIKYQKQAIALCGRGGDQSCVASGQRNLGRTFLKVNKKDSAVYFLTASYELKKALNDSVGITYALNDMADLASMDGDIPKAVEFLRQSSLIRSALKDSAGLAININNIGEAYFMQEDWANAGRYFEESLVLSSKLKYTDLQRHTLSMLGKVYTQSGDYPKAYLNLQRSTALNDSIYSVEKARAISELQTKFDTEKKERLIESQQSELRWQRLVGLSLLSVILLVGSFIYYRIFQRRKYEREIQSLRLKQELHNERERISRDLHDSVGANLTRIITDLDLMSLTAAVPAPALQQVDDTRSFTQGTIRLLRDTIWAMNKDTFSSKEFAKKAEAFLQYYLGDRIAWLVDIDIQQERQLSSTEVLNLLRILQEATQNMLKYANADNYQVVIRSDDKFSLLIKDNGAGMELSEQHVDDHYGLYNMRQRAENIGANFTLSSAAGAGVGITIVL